MENTMGHIFPNDSAEWFVAIAGQTRGPMFGHEVFALVEKKELNWIDFVYRAKEGKWIRLSEHPTFSTLLPTAPKAPEAPVIPAAVVVVPPPPPANELKEWFTYKDQTQTGPYSVSEMKRLATGVDPSTVYVWKTGLAEWKLLKDMREFSPVNPPASPIGRLTPVAATTDSSTASEKRQAPRKPLVARIYLTNQSDLVIGICRDVSVGGMQVLSDKVPGNPGTIVKIHVDPPADSKIKGFTAEGMIVRLLEDQRGFSFRFTKILDPDRNQIDQYIRESAT